MANGKINIFQPDNTTGNRPHWKGYITIDDVVHELAMWPAKSGKGYSGTYKPKESYTPAAEPTQAMDKLVADIKQAAADSFGDEIPF
jgi:hypothetical protein